MSVLNLRPSDGVFATAAQRFPDSVWSETTALRRLRRCFIASLATGNVDHWSQVAELCVAEHGELEVPFVGRGGDIIILSAVTDGDTISWDMYSDVYSIDYRCDIGGLTTAELFLELQRI